MENKISVRQVCFVLIAYNAVLKLIIMPTYLAVSCQNDLIFPALINLALQAVVIWAVAYASSRADKPLFDMLAERFGKGLACVVFVLLGLYFILVAIVPLVEQQLLVHSAFYDTVPSLYAFLPFFLFGLYAGSRTVMGVGRCADICMPVFVLCIAVFFIMSVGQADYSNLLPVLRTPFLRLSGGALSCAFKFSDAAFMLVFFGNYKYKKGDAAKITLSYIFGGIVVLALMTIFYGVYGAMTPSRTFLLNEIALFFPAVGHVGRIDLIFLYALDMVILFALALYIHSSVYCFSRVFNCNNRALISVGVNAILLVIILLTNNKFSALYKVAEGWFWIPTLLFSYLLPLGTLLIKRRKQ